MCTFLFCHNSLLTTEDFVTEWKLMLGISSFFPSIYMFGFIRRACISLLNPLPLKLVTIWHPQPFSLYWRHGFCSKLDDVEENRVKWICDPVYYQINIAISLLSSVLINLFLDPFSQLIKIKGRGEERTDKRIYSMKVFIQRLIPVQSFCDVFQSANDLRLWHFRSKTNLHF